MKSLFVILFELLMENNNNNIVICAILLFFKKKKPRRGDRDVSSSVMFLYCCSVRILCVSSRCSLEENKLNYLLMEVLVFRGGRFLQRLRHSEIKPVHLAHVWTMSWTRISNVYMCKNIDLHFGCLEIPNLKFMTCVKQTLSPLGSICAARLLFPSFTVGFLLDVHCVFKNCFCCCTDTRRQNTRSLFLVEN